MTRLCLVGLLVASAVFLASPASAQPEESKTTSALRAANDALRASRYGQAAVLARPITQNGKADPADRAEAFRVYGLALFFMKDRAGAEAALLEYIKLDADAHLDPGVVPPEAVVFFEDLRSRHAAMLRASRPRLKRKLHWWYNLAPPLGQIQNGQRGKGWFIAITGGLALATNITTFFVLRSWCDSVTGVCGNEDNDRRDNARTLEVVNMASGVVAIGMYAYGVFDGLTGYRRVKRQERTMSLGVTPVGGGGAALHLRGRF